MTQGINITMLLLLFAIGGGAYVTSKSPAAMTAIAAWLMSRAEAAVKHAEYRAERHAAWKAALGIE